MVWILIDELKAKGLLSKEAFVLVSRRYACSRKVKEAIEAFESISNVAKAQEFFDKWKGRRFKASVKAYTIFPEGWSVEKNLLRLNEVYREMICDGIEPDVVSYGIMIHVYCKVKKYDEAIEMFREMERKKIKATPHVYCTLINGLGSEKRIMYAGDNGGLKEGENKMDKVWISYCGMPVCFGLKEFAIVTGLRCNCPEEPSIKKTPYKGSNKRKVKKAGLLGIVGPSYKVKDLIADLKNKDIPKHYREKLCLVWFGHVKPFLSSESISRITRIRFLIQDPLVVVHPWIVPTIDELGMTPFHTLGLIDTKEDPTMELINKELDGETSIRRAVRQGQSNVEALHDLTQTAIDPGGSSRGVAGGVVCDGGSYPASASAVNRDYEHVGAQQKINIYEKTPCTEAIAEAVEELKTRRGVIPSNEVREPCIPTVEVRRKRIKIRQILSVLKSAKNATPPGAAEEGRHICGAWQGEEEGTGRIHQNEDRYADLHNPADSGGLGFDQLVSTFQWDEEVIKYVRGKRPYPHGKSWTKAKKILAVMNVDVTRFLTVEILLYKGKIKVYDCKLPVFSEKTFLTHIQSLLKLLPKLLTQSKLMDHLPAEVLEKKSWVFEGQNKNIQLPKNTTGAACGPYSLAYMECLLTGTNMYKDRDEHDNKFSFQANSLYI
ncbi:Pentatricopeptide repeat-containing protein, mitochondrial [Capsicum annuum]|nr:Pentatricopeptide repeat-containing protein, mitochondrial [Capsicum annuum]